MMAASLAGHAEVGTIAPGGPGRARCPVSMVPVDPVVRSGPSFLFLHHWMKDGEGVRNAALLMALHQVVELLIQRGCNVTIGDQDLLPACSSGNVLSHSSYHSGSSPFSFPNFPDQPLKAPQNHVVGFGSALEPISKPSDKPTPIRREVSSAGRLHAIGCSSFDGTLRGRSSSRRPPQDASTRLRLPPTLRPS